MIDHHKHQPQDTCQTEDSYCRNADYEKNRGHLCHRVAAQRQFLNLLYITLFNSIQCIVSVVRDFGTDGRLN